MILVADLTKQIEVPVYVAKLRFIRQAKFSLTLILLISRALPQAGRAYTTYEKR